ncbi:MAG: hypothetical protein R2725_12515 [Solirubrobacterales bacterium]
MSWARRVGSTYVRIGKAYWAWAPALLLAAVIVFLPLGLLDAVSVHYDVEDFQLDSGFKVAAVLGAIAAITTTGLLGEVFYAGVIAALLTHSGDERRPGLRHIARHLDYGRLIAVDLLYVFLVIAGLVLAIVPGVLAYVWLGLAGPVVEIEGRGVWESLRRSASLVRRNFWFVAAIVIPIEIVGDGAGEGVTALVHTVLGHSFLASWVADSAAAIFLTPVLGVAAVLLTVDLIAAKDGTRPLLNPRPTPTDAPVPA